MYRVRPRPLQRARRLTLLLLAVVFASSTSAPLGAQATCSPLPTTPGSLDTCFGLNGYVVADVTGSGDFQAPTVVKVQPDGRLLVGGYSRQLGSTGTELFLMRLLPDGGLDASFGVDGIVKTHLTSPTTRTERVKGIAVLPPVLPADGKIVVLAQVPGAQNGPYTFGVVRYNSDGSLDPTFGSQGVVTFGFEKNVDAWAAALVVLPLTNKLLVAGHSSRENSSLVALARLNEDGTFDRTFDGDGKATFSVGRNTRPAVYSMVLDGDEAVIVGVLSGNGLMMRVTTAGALDTSFNGKGWTTLDFAGGGDYLTSVAIDGLGRIVAGGRADRSTAGTGAQTDMGLVRYQQNGTLDGTFGTGGTVTLDVNDTVNVLSGLAIQGDGRIVVTGEATQPFAADTVVARFNDNGSLDDGSINDATPLDRFATAGVTVTDFSGFQDYPAGLILQPDADGQKIVVLSNVDGSRLVGLTRYFQ